MTKKISFYGKSNLSNIYAEIIMEPQQIHKSKPSRFLDYVKISDFPIDYIEFIDFFGEGLLGDYIRIFPINFINYLIPPWRRRTKKNTFFNNCTVISHEQLSKSLIIGDTLDNAQLIYFDGNYYIYNIEVEECIIKIGESIKDIVEWFANGKFYSPMIMDKFVPFDSDKTVSPLSRIIGGFFYDFERKY